MVVMPLNCDPVATTPGAVELERRAAAGVCAVDYGFWGGVVPGNLSQLVPMWEEGVLGFKCFLVHSGIDEFANVGEGELDEAMGVLAKLGPRGPVLLAHAEDAVSIAQAEEESRLGDEPRSYARYLASRPAGAEEAAIGMLIRLCERHRTRVHVVHLASGGSLGALRNARAAGLPISVETCPHYLAFAAGDICDGETVYKCAPPIRGSEHREALWAGLRSGDIDLVASDHSPCPPHLKCLNTGDFAQSWGGISSLQLGLSVVWTHAAARGIGLGDVARWMSEAPARLAGLEGRKGCIAEGADADLVVFDEGAEWTVDASGLEHRHKFTPYDGGRLCGRVKRTYLRGRMIFEDDAPVERRFPEPPTGQWLRRTQEC